MANRQESRHGQEFTVYNRKVQDGTGQPVSLKVPAAEQAAFQEAVDSLVDYYKSCERSHAKWPSTWLLMAYIASGVDQLEGTAKSKVRKAFEPREERFLAAVGEDIDAALDRFESIGTVPRIAAAYDTSLQSVRDVLNYAETQEIPVAVDTRNKDRDFYGSRPSTSGGSGKVAGKLDFGKSKRAAARRAAEKVGPIE